MRNCVKLLTLRFSQNQDKFHNSYGSTKDPEQPNQTKIEKDTCNPVFIAALFTIARTWKQHRCPLADEWINKICTCAQWNITQT